MDQIIYSEKIQKKSVYRNKFEQYCQAQKQQSFSPNPLLPATHRDIATVQNPLRPSGNVPFDKKGMNLQFIRGGISSQGGNNKSFVANTIDFDRFSGGMQQPQTKFTTIGKFDNGSYGHSPSILSQSREATSYKSNKIANAPIKIHLQPKPSGGFKNQSPMDVQNQKKFLQHVRVPVQIMPSTAHPPMIAQFKNFKEDEASGQNYNSILINRRNLGSNNLSLEPSLSKLKNDKIKFFGQGSSGGVSGSATRGIQTAIMSQTSPNQFFKKNESYFDAKGSQGQIPQSIMRIQSSGGVHTRQDIDHLIGSDNSALLLQNAIGKQSNRMQKGSAFQKLTNTNPDLEMHHKESDYKTQPESDSHFPGGTTPIGAAEQLNGSPEILGGRNSKKQRRVQGQNQGVFSEQRHRKRSSAVGFVEDTGSKRVIGGIRGQFDSSSIEMGVESRGAKAQGAKQTQSPHIPSLNQMPGASARNNDTLRKSKNRTAATKDKKQGQFGGENMGYVNYVNGVPVSIQLNENDLFAKDGVIGRHLRNRTVGNWQQNMMLRNRAMMTAEGQKNHYGGNSDFKSKQQMTTIDQIGAASGSNYQQYNQTILSLQGSGSGAGEMLPKIDINLQNVSQSRPFKSNNVKPDYYQKRRKANFSNVFEVFDDDIQTPGALDSDGYRTKGTTNMNNQTDTASYKITSERKARGYQTETRNQRTNFKHVTQSDEKQGGSLPRHGQRLTSRKQSKGPESIKSGPGGSQHNAIEEVEKIMQSPTKPKLPVAATQANATNTGRKSVHIKQKKSKTTMGGTQTKGLLQKVQEKHANADLRAALMSSDDNGENDLPINLQINNNQPTAAAPQNANTTTNTKSPIQKRKSRMTDKPSQNFDSTRETRRQKLYPGVNQHKTFEKVDLDPGLFKIRVMREDLEHLSNDDLDEISKFEVIYKILKDQLRNHQKKLIKLKEIDAKEKERLRIEREKEELRLRREAYKNAPKTQIKAITGYTDQDRQDLIARINKNKQSKRDDARSLSKGPKETVDLKEFVRHIRPFEWYGSQRDLSPELKRIVKNLTCQEHSYVYCPCCKSYDEVDHDPMANIRKFMRFIKQEQERIQKYQPEKTMQLTTVRKADGKKSVQVEKQVNMPKKSQKDIMPDDSVSEITDLEEEEILAKYYRNKDCHGIFNKKPQQKEEQKESEDQLEDHKCKSKKKETEEERQKRFLNETIELELRQPQIGPTMHDEDNSAHQFSYRNISIQADSEERLEMEMQASEMQEASPLLLDKIRSSKSLKSTRSINLSPLKEVPRQTNGKLRQKDMLYKPWIQRSDAGIQTDFNTAIASKLKLELSKTKSNSVELIPDADENEFDLESEAEQAHKAMDLFKEDWGDSIVFQQAIRDEKIKRGLPLNDDDEIEQPPQYQNELDQLDIDNAQDASAQDQMGLGFLKKFSEKGNIQTLTEQEITYVKSLLKQEAEIWENQSTLEDLYRHCKFSIRMMTRQLARIDNRQVFKENQEVTRESTLVMVYRAEMLYQAKGDATRIFTNLARYQLDQDEFDKRIQKQTKQLTKDDEKFLNKREHLIKRLLSQVNNFQSMYKIFSEKFVYKGVEIREYLLAELEKITVLKALHEKYKTEIILGMSVENEHMTEEIGQ